MWQIKSVRQLFVGSVILAVSACASPGKLTDDPNDPYEATNRSVFEFNRVVDRNFLRPISSGYRTVVPEVPRQGISNFFRNLREPLVLLNDLLQGNFKHAGRTTGRFVINTTIGIGGFLKASDSMGIPYHSEDFGQTLAVWGVDNGNYLVLPFFGPSSTRDGFGLAVDIFTDPVSYGILALNEEGLLLSKVALETLDTRARLHSTIDALYEEDDPYVFARTAYRQQREFQIRNGARDTETDDIFDELEDEEEGGNE